MKRGDYIVMTKEFTTYCGKEYKVGHVGLLREDVDEDDCEVNIQFGVHSGWGSSCIPIKSFQLAKNQQHAEKQFNLGREKGKCMMY